MSLRYTDHPRIPVCEAAEGVVKTGPSKELRKARGGPGVLNDIVLQNWPCSPPFQTKKPKEREPESNHRQHQFVGAASLLSFHLSRIGLHVGCLHLASHPLHSGVNKNDLCFHKKLLILKCSASSTSKFNEQFCFIPWLKAY